MASSNVQFFWDRKNRKLNRSRFNLLLLEHGEYFLEDFSAFLFPLPGHLTDLSHLFEIKDVKIQGRIKLCSRCMLFEPNDVRYPLMKFPFRNMPSASDAQQFHLKREEAANLSVQVTGFFTFLITSYLEMKANDKIGPYQVMDGEPGASASTASTASASASGAAGGYRMLFALVHADLSLFLVKIEQLRHVASISVQQGYHLANQHLRPFIETALIATFDTSHLVDFHEKFLLSSPMAVRKIRPLLAIPGALMITKERVYYQPTQLNNISEVTQAIPFKRIKMVYRRCHLLRSVGLEIMLADGSSVLFVFDSIADRESIYSLMTSLYTPSEVCLEEATRRWQRREMSNFDYLMYLNNVSGRSMNDLTQYPVFPHIIADYTSKHLNLTAPATFRDLSQPIGALTPERLSFFMERYHSMAACAGDAHDSTNIPPFLYGTHYSTPGYVLFYLVRVAPEYMLCLQNGRFDAADRMFYSLKDMWESCLTNPADLKELIPEFFVNGDFLVNYDSLDLGHRHSGERLGDVVLPPWADSPRNYIRKHQKALESEHVSAHLHQWIDLIFGYKQQGQPAIEARNLFYYLTYEGSVDVEAIRDVREKAAIEAQIQEFGQCPSQLFKTPHASRNDHRGPAKSAHSAGHGHGHGQSNSHSSIAVASSSSLRDSNQGISSMLSQAMLPSKPVASQPKLSVAVDENLVEDVGLMHLGEDFRLAVADEMARGSNNRSSPVVAAPVVNRNHTISPPMPPAPPQPVVLPSSPAAQRQLVGIEFSSIHLLPTELFYFHSKAVASLVLRMRSQPTPSGGMGMAPVQLTEGDYFLPQSARRRLSAVLCSVAKDSLLKVIRIEQEPRADLAPSALSTIALISSAAASPLRTSCTISRSYAASGSSLSSVVCLQDSNKVLLASWDNNIYGYSIANANAMGKRYAHYDSVTAIATDLSNKHLVSGSMDASVKIWAIRPASAATAVLSSSPTAELNDHDYPIICVDADPSGTYAGAGAEDGSVLVWEISSQSLLFTYQASPSKRSVTSIKFLSSDGIKVVAATADGRLVCLDMTGRLLASISVPSPVLCLDVCSGTSPALLAAGCADGSVRIFSHIEGRISELAKYLQAHGGPVTALALGGAEGGDGNSIAELMATGSEDCSIRLWRLCYSR